MNRKGNGMQVYFDTSLWLSKKGRPCKVRQDTDAVFTEGGLTRCVPTVYCFKQGIVFDILTVVEEKEIAEYFEKYKGLEKKADSLSDTQVQQIMQENPYQNVALKGIWLNGEKEQDISFSSTGYLPLVREKESRSMIRLIREAYSDYLGEAACFFCQRVCVKTKQDFTVCKLNSIRLEVDRKHKIYVLDEETSAAPGEEGCMQFIHPLTHIRHRVYIYDAKKLDAPGVFDGRLEYSLATAEIVPGLGKDEQLKFGSSISCTASDKKKGAVSIVGGQSSGPVSVFFAGRKTEQKSRYGGDMQPCFSKPYWKDERDSMSGKFCLTGLECLVEEEQIIDMFPDEQPGGQERRGGRV